ncbi:MAG: hypothetical protein IKQ37_01730 [Bacteroidaceae bacterium]|jgi:hypothetical protein|nr:hypothetical protein [Bacteroidaceae bacterium]
MNESKVVIPQEVVEQSKEKKRSHKSMRQTQIYRDAANLKYLIVQSMADAPRKYAKYFDEMLVSVSNAKQSLALALESGSEVTRAENLSYAKVLAEDIMDDTVIMSQLGVIGKDRKKAIRRLAQKVAGQSVKLRDYFKSQGIGING